MNQNAMSTVCEIAFAAANAESAGKFIRDLAEISGLAFSTTIHPRRERRLIPIARTASRRPTSRCSDFPRPMHSSGQPGSPVLPLRSAIKQTAFAPARSCAASNIPSPEPQRRGRLRLHFPMSRVIIARRRMRNCLCATISRLTRRCSPACPESVTFCVMSLCRAMLLQVLPTPTTCSAMKSCSITWTRSMPPWLRRCDTNCAPISVNSRHSPAATHIIPCSGGGSFNLDQAAVRHSCVGSRKRP
jgi:hypothetical protein